MKSIVESEPFLCFNRQGLETILPHRGAALNKIDGLLYRTTVARTATGVKQIRYDDPDLDGHFPGAPTYPGYAQDEFVCMVAAALIPLAGDDLKSAPHVVQKSVRYKQRVAPGDTLIATVQLIEARSKFYIYAADIRNQRDEIVTEYDRIVGAVPGAGRST